MKELVDQGYARKVPLDQKNDKNLDAWNLIMEFTIPINREKSESFSTAQRGLEEFRLATCYTRVHI